jgi:hypothetical protein
MFKLGDPVRRKREPKFGRTDMVGRVTEVGWLGDLGDLRYVTVLWPETLDGTKRPRTDQHLVKNLIRAGSEA